MLSRRSMLSLALLAASVTMAHAQDIPVSTPAAPLPHILPRVIPDSAQMPTSSWYVSPQLGVVIHDQGHWGNDARQAGLSLGRWISPGLTLDLGSTFSHGVGQGRNASLGITGRWYEGQPGAPTRWYFMGGVGTTRQSSVVRANSGWSPTLRAGLGLQHTFNDRIALRTEISLRRTQDSSASNAHVVSSQDYHNDAMATVGVVIGLDRAPSPSMPSETWVTYHQDLGVSPPAAPPRCETQDSDHDSVDNCVDRCPNTDEGTYVGPDGCPATVVIDLRGLNFKAGRPWLIETVITPSLLAPTQDSLQVLDQAADLLSRKPHLRVDIVGYTNSSGSIAYNQALSERRAEAVANYLIDHGVDPRHIRNVQGEGNNVHIGLHETKEGRAADSQVELHPAVKDHL